MDLAERYAGEAPFPTAANFDQTFAYMFNEQRRRAYNSTDGLSDAELSQYPNHGGWSIGEILAHQLYLLRFMAETMEPGSTSQLPKSQIGAEGAWNLDVIIAEREILWDRLEAVFAKMTPDGLMETRPNLNPAGWAEWPVMMRVLRPLIDYATHIGQVNYARRQLGNPVKRV